MRVHHLGLAVSALALALPSCEKAPAPAARASADAPAITWPISLNAAMVGMIDHSADYLFALGNGDMPRNANDWHLVSNSAYEIVLGGAVIAHPGTGEFDKQWTETEDWQRLAHELTGIGTDALKLADAQSTDQKAWRAVGDRLIQNCLACHAKFKPEIPSQGVLRGSTERQSRGESIFGY